MGNIWADMICAYYPPDRLIPCMGKDGTYVASAQWDRLKNGFLSARVDVAESVRFGSSGIQNLLDKLLDGGYITPSEYVSRLPVGIINDQQSLIERLKETEISTEETNT